MSHDVDPEVHDVEPDEAPQWYVWRRSDSFVGITNVDPHAIFTTDYKYKVLCVVSDAATAYYQATVARAAN